MRAADDVDRMNQATFRAWARRLRPRRRVTADNWLELSERAWRWAHAETWCRAAHAMIREDIARGSLVDQATPILSAVGNAPGDGNYGLYTSPTPATLLDIETPPELRALMQELVIPDSSRDDAASRALAELRCSRFYLAMNQLFWHRRAALGTHGSDESAARDGEQWVLEGHPWHPMTRTRVGLSVAESLRHAPELLGAGPIQVLEVPADWVQATTGWNEAQRGWLGAPSPGRIRIPMHAAQLCRWTQMLGGLPAPCRIVKEHKDGRSLLSLRTVALEEHDLHVKLALDVLTTSATRTVSPMSTLNGPRISRALEEPLSRDPCVRPLRLIPDRHTISMSVPGFESLARHSGAILRARPDGGHHSLIVAASLGSTPPGSTTTVLRSLLSRGDPRARGGPIGLIRALSESLLRPAVHVLVRYGVALETHLQNLLLEFSGGDLQGVHVRDLGGIRILRGADVPVEIPPLHPASFIETTDFDELIDKFIHTTLHATFHSVMEWTCREAELDRAEVWRIAARGLRSSLAPLRRHDDAQTRARAELAERRIFAPRVRAKALMTMRLTGRFSTYDTIWVDNPLAGLHEVPDDDVVEDAPPS